MNLFTFRACARFIRRHLRRHDVYAHPMLVNIIVRLVYEQWAARPFVVYDRSIAVFNRRQRPGIAWDKLAKICPRELMGAQRDAIALAWRRERRLADRDRYHLRDLREAVQSRQIRTFSKDEQLAVLRCRQSAEKSGNEALVAALDKAIYTCRP